MEQLKTDTKIMLSVVHNEKHDNQRRYPDYFG